MAEQVEITFISDIFTFKKCGRIEIDNSPMSVSWVILLIICGLTQLTLQDRYLFFKPFFFQAGFRDRNDV